MKKTSKHKDFLKATVAIMVTFTLLLTSSSVIAYNITTNKNNNLGNTIFVGGIGPGNYSTIQEGIAASSNGDTVFVYDGIYTLIYPDNIVIDKEITLQGQSRENTIIEMDDSWPWSLPNNIPVSIKVLADNVNIIDFSLWFTKLAGGFVSDGVIFEDSSNSKVENCYIGPSPTSFAGINVRYGVYMKVVSDDAMNNQIINCDIVYSQAYDPGQVSSARAIYITGSSEIVISGCSSTKYVNGFHLENVVNASIQDCNIKSTLILDTIKNVLIDGCEVTKDMMGSSAGIYIAPGGISQDIIINECTIYDKNKGIYIPNKSHDIEINQCTIYNADFGIEVVGPDDKLRVVNIQIIDNDIYQTDIGIRISDSNEVEIAGCEIYNSGTGIDTDTCEFINVIDCDIHDNSIGIKMDSLRTSLILNNVISYNAVEGINLGSLTGETPTTNKIHHNRYIENNIHVTFIASVNQNNRWDDGFEGSYWADYEGKYPSATNDGIIWDTPYEVKDGSYVFDRYPLVSGKPTFAQVNIIQPTGDEEIPFGLSVPITYEVFDILAEEPIPDAEITIEYNIDNGEWIEIESGLPNTGEYLWEIPNFSIDDSTNYRIRIKADYGGSTGYDRSNKISIDATPPVVNISRPLIGDILLFDSILTNLPLPFAVAIGPVTILADAEDTMSGINHVLFELGDSSFEDVEAPFSWSFNGRVIGKRTLTVTAVDNVDRTTQTTMDIFIINPFGS